MGGGPLFRGPLSTARPVTGSEPVPSLLSLPHVHFVYLPQPPPFLRKLPFVVSAPLKIAQQVLSILLALLWWIPHPPEYILAQVSFLSPFFLREGGMRKIGEESTQHSHLDFGMAGRNIAGKQSHHRLA